MRIRAFALFFGLLTAAFTADAATVISRTGTPSGFWLVGAGFNPAYVSWNQGVGTAFSDVSVSVTLSSSDGNPASGTAYITNAVGPGATAANVIAGPVTVGTSSITATPVAVPFGTVNLPQGATYFLVIQQGSGNLQWNFANPATETLSAAPTVSSNNDGLGAAPATPAYNASFSAAGSPAKGLLVSVTGNPPADVSITKSGPATATAGNNVSYTVTVTNNGPGSATGVSVADTTPSGLTFVSNSGACITAYPCSLGTLASAGSAVITSTYTVNSATTGSVSNTSTVSTTAFDLVPGNNSATSSMTVSASTDLAITKTGPATIIAGNNITYTVTVTNNGPSTATGVSVADTTPPGLTFVSNSGGCTTAYPCSIGTLAPSGSATITSTYTVGAAATGTISNTSTVSSTTTDPTPGNNSATASTTVSASTDLSITKTGPATITAGSNVSFTVTVTNNGPSNATGVSVADSTPANLTFVSNSGGCTTAYPCSIGALASGASATITSTYTVAPSFSGNISNTATVSSTTTDPTPANNSATATVSTTASSDVAITKTGPATVSSGGNITYTVTVTNNGPSTATGVSVADVTPANLTFVSNTGGCTTAYPCTIGSMNSGASVTITSTYTTSPTFSGTISNTATVSSTSADSNSANNSATASTTAGISSDVSVTTTAPATATANADVTYTITVGNSGPSTATGVVVTDVLPASVTFVSATPSTGTCSGTTTITCTLGTVASGASPTITLVVHTASNLTPTTSISDTATVSSTSTDPNAANNSSTASLLIVAPISVPALTPFGMGLLGLMLAAGGAILQRRRATS